MLDFNDVSLETLVIHEVGNPTHEEDLRVSKKPVEIEDELILELLHKYFLKPFKGENFFRFQHETSLDFNEVYHYAKAIFADPEACYLQSINIARHLFKESSHPNIKSGELYTIYFKDIKVNGDYVDAIGLFKSENKETYLKVYEENNVYNVDQQTGVNINKLDKGCLIFDLDQEEGYRVCMVDSTKKSSEIANYWQHDFLGLKPREDNFFHTKTVLDLCKGFCDDVFTPDNEVAKTDQLMLMDRSISYFQKHEEFNVKQFEDEVIVDPGVIETFNNYKEGFLEQRDIQTYDEFDISEPAVKGQKKFFKSVLKLDKKFHVYIHGGHDYIESGFDEERNMRYYKLFFMKES